MKITEKQLQLLYLLLTDSVKVDINRVFSLDYNTRKELWEQITNQQDNQLIEISE